MLHAIFSGLIDGLDYGCFIAAVIGTIVAIIIGICKEEISK